MPSSLTLPTGAVIRLGDDVALLLSCGVVVSAPVRVEPTPDGLLAEIAACCERLRAEHDGRLPSEIPALQDARHLYRSVGTDPTRTRPSSEALLRRVIKGRSLYVISNAVDACNLASLSFLLPIGMYDLGRVHGDIELRLGRTGEEYPGIRKGDVHLEGRLGLFDADGPFGSPTSDSARTMVTPSARSLLAVIMAPADYPTPAMIANVDMLADLYERHCEGKSTLRGLLNNGKEAT